MWKLSSFKYHIWKHGGCVLINQIWFFEGGKEKILNFLKKILYEGIQMITTIKSNIWFFSSKYVFCM